MEILIGLLWIALILSAIGLVLGMIRPVYSLWFIARMNRLKVLKTYGFAVLLISVLLILL